MKRWLPLLVLVLAAAWLASSLRPQKSPGEIDLAAFGRLPVLVNGRIKPLDTVARTSLLVLQNRQLVKELTDSKPLVATPSAWLADVLFNPAKADDYPTFRLSATDSPELLTLMGVTEADTKVVHERAILRILALADFVPSTRTRFSFNKLQPKLAELDRQARLADPVEPQLRTAYQKAVVQLRDRVLLYQRLKHSVQWPNSPDFLREIIRFQQGLPAGIAAVHARQKGEAHDEAAFTSVLEAAERYDGMSQLGYLLTVPPPASDPDPTHWKSAGLTLLDTFSTGDLNPTVMAYAALGSAWRSGDATQFNEIVRLFREQLGKRFAPQLAKSDAETRFNAAEPFYRSLQLYVIAFLLAIFSWLKWPEVLGRSAFYLTLLAFLATTAGIATRMWLEGRPPVTNLYSSALFVGWGSVGLCLILEKVYRNAIGSVAAGMIGFCTLLIAHHLSLSGDTLEMMRAVLDTNLWLATHVVIVTIGYAATFLAGFLALIYICRGTLTKSLDQATGDALTRMVYGIVCFATFCSLTGTVLGGIWADQSWGRFWGWDPKENGALMIVLWNAIILHARWGGLVKQRGLMCLAIFGNIITSWSWFGTNMLGVGLHSYGFMDAAFYWLTAFVVSQLVIIALAQIPPRRWRSFRTTATT
ncbi:MAG TPA: cytochrome c biogenesis protein CcsA [Lacunisphaera sp.]|nr:cytochrome c biogenesis protein CcsA [Lacunisphaera sp.]